MSLVRLFRRRSDNKHITTPSAESSSPAMILTDLPPELLEQILTHLDKRDLKSLRQTCKSLIITTAWLFKSLTIYPHLTSFDRLNNVSNSRHIAECVRHLWYNTAYRGLQRIPLKVLSRGMHDPTKEQTLALIVCLQELHTQTLMGGNTSDELTQMELFRTTLPNLSNLQSLHVVEFPVLEKRGQKIAPGDRSLPLPDFYERLLSPHLAWSKQASNRLMDEVMNDPEPRQSHALSLIAGASQVDSLRELAISGLQWDDFLSQPDLFKRPVLFDPVFRRLKRLSLKAMLTQTHIWDADVMLNLQDMLRMCTNLEHLTLWFRHCHDMDIGGQPIYDFDAGQHCESIFQLDFVEDDFDANLPVRIDDRLCWAPRLQSLEVEGLVCTFKEFKAVFREHAKTLRSVRLSGLLLLPGNTKSAPKGEGPRACLVRMFKWLQKHLDLDEFDIYGPLSNGGRQNWSFFRTKRLSSLYQKIISFVQLPATTKAECPLEYLAIQEGQFDLCSSRYTMEVPQELEGLRYQGDDSLLVRYKKFDEVPSDDDDEDDDLDSDDDDSDNTDSNVDSEDSEWEDASEGGSNDSMPELEDAP